MILCPGFEGFNQTVHPHNVILTFVILIVFFKVFVLIFYSPSLLLYKPICKPFYTWFLLFFNMF